MPELLALWPHRDFNLEDEVHTCIACPQYAVPREGLWRSMSTPLSQQISICATYTGKLMTLLGSQLPSDWGSLGSFLAHLRQARRKFRNKFEHPQLQRRRRNFFSKRCEWRERGFPVCRHGVFF